MAGKLKGKATLGSCRTLYNAKASKQVKELIEAGEDTVETPETLPRASKRDLTPVSKLSNNQVETALDAFAMGKSLLCIAGEMKVDERELSRLIKKRMGVVGNRKYQQAREIVLWKLHRLEQKCDEAILSTPIQDLTPKWIDAKLRVIRTISDIYGIMNKSPIEENVRVAGLSSKEVEEQIMRRL